MTDISWASEYNFPCRVEHVLDYLKIDSLAKLQATPLAKMFGYINFSYKSAIAIKQRLNEKGIKIWDDLSDQQIRRLYLRFYYRNDR